MDEMRRVSPSLAVVADLDAAAIVCYGAQCGVVAVCCLLRCGGRMVCLSGAFFCRLQRAHAAPALQRAKGGAIHLSRERYALRTKSKVCVCPEDVARGGRYLSAARQTARPLRKSKREWSKR